MNMGENGKQMETLLFGCVVCSVVNRNSSCKTATLSVTIHTNPFSYRPTSPFSLVTLSTVCQMHFQAS